MQWNHCNPATLRYLFTNTLNKKMETSKIQLQLKKEDLMEWGLI